MHHVEVGILDVNGEDLDDQDQVVECDEFNKDGIHIAQLKEKQRLEFPTEVEAAADDCGDPDFVLQDGLV